MLICSENLYQIFILSIFNHNAFVFVTNSIVEYTQFKRLYSYNSVKFKKGIIFLCRLYNILFFQVDLDNWKNIRIPRQWEEPENGTTKV